MIKNKQLIGRRIKELRKMHKMTQEDLSGEIDIDAKHLSSIEVGRSYPSLFVLEKIIKVLNIEMIDIFDYSYKSHSPKQLRVIAKKMIDQVHTSKLEIIIKLIRWVDH